MTFQPRRRLTREQMEEIREQAEKVTAHAKFRSNLPMPYFDVLGRLKTTKKASDIFKKDWI